MLSFLRSKFTLLKNKLFKKDALPLVAPHYDYKLLQKAQGRFWPRFSQLRQIQRILNRREKLTLWFAVLLFLVGFFWAGGNWVKAHRIEVPAVGGTVIEAVVGSPQFINPIFSSTNDVDADIGRLVYSGLMRYDEKGRLLPDLAVKYTVSADKKVYTFQLRQDVYWHDGEHFTATDVVYTIETMQNVLVASPLYLNFQDIKVEAPHDYTVVFTLSEPYALFLSTLTVGILPEHVWFNVPPEQMRLAQINIQPVGTGPFRFKRLAKDESGKIYSYELERFDRFYRQPPFLQGFIFQFYSDYEGDTGAVQALREQKTQTLSFVPKNLRDRVERKHIVLRTLELPQYTALFFNQTNNASLADKDVRLALGEAIDRERILKEAIHGEGQVVNSPVLPGFPGYDANLGKLDYNLSNANALLDKNWQRVSASDYLAAEEKRLLAEWQKNNAGTASTTASSTTVSSSTEQIQQEIKTKLETELNQAQTFYRRNKEGKILEINLVTVGTPEYQQAAGLIAGFWQGLGVKTNVQYVAARDFVKDVLKIRSYDVLLYGELLGGNPDQFPFWHSSQVEYPGLNLASYVNRNVDAILQKARTDVAESEKSELYKKFQEILLSERPAIFLYAPTYTYALADAIKGVDVTRVTQPADRFTDLTSWYLRTTGQWHFN